MQINNVSFGMALKVKKGTLPILLQASERLPNPEKSYRRFTKAILANQEADIYDVHYNIGNKASIRNRFSGEEDVFENVRTIDDLSPILEQAIEKDTLQKQRLD